VAGRRRQSPEDRILKQVIKKFERSQRQMAKPQIRCAVSNRFIAFSETSDLLDSGEDYMFMDVMTSDADGEPRKLCELIIDRRDLLKTLAGIKSRPFRKRDSGLSD